MTDQRTRHGAGPLTVQDLTVRYGGVIAVNSLSFVAGAASVTGLIGPNGAGKTTTFNACSGLLTPSEGQVHLYGEDVTSASPQARARRGLGRTFQRMQLFDSLTVEENAALGREAGLAGSSILGQLIGRRGEHDQIAEAAADALRLCGLEGIAHETSGALSTGQRRLVELCRVVAGRFSVLLLDEPSSGLDREETARFGEILRTLADERDAAVLLVEHDVELVMNVCDRVYVLDFGNLIFEGTAEEAGKSDVVRAAYLGSAA